MCTWPSPASIGRHVLALLGYVAIGIAFAWPLPLQISTALPGPVSGDTGVYIWNLWVFRHAVVAHGEMPFFTTEILSLSPAVPMTLQNYTTLANLVAFPLLPLIGLVATYNVLVIGSGVASAYAMFLCARRLSGDAAAGWVAGLAFGFSPYMSARAMEHFSLVQAAPLPLFVMLFERLHFRPTPALAALTGAVVAAAFLCDPYYGVYCLLIGVFAIVYAAVVIHRAPLTFPPRPAVISLDIALVCLAGLVAGIMVSGGRRVEIFSIQVSMTKLYTPVLALSILALARLWLMARPRLTWTRPPMAFVRAGAVAAVACAVLLTPVLSALVGAAAERNWSRPRVLWRSSPPGMDLLAFFVPNPLHPWFGGFFAEGARLMPGGFAENIGSIPWVLTAALVAAVACGREILPRYWLLFTAFAASLALGPFVRIGDVMTYIPTPWALLRYVPVVGAARMPQRMTVLVMLGLSILLAFALRALRERASGGAGPRWRPAALTTAVTAALLFEMLPAPRALSSAAVPEVNRIIAADPRDVRVLNLPFGLRDGMTSHGNASASGQYFQTVHEKQLIGGYVSRLPGRSVRQYRRLAVTRVLMALSENREVSERRRHAAIDQAHALADTLNIGYVVVDTRATSADLMDFARAAFRLTPVATDGPYALYRTGRLPAIPLANPGTIDVPPPRSPPFGG